MIKHGNTPAPHGHYTVSVYHNGQLALKFFSAANNEITNWLVALDYLKREGYPDATMGNISLGVH